MKYAVETLTHEFSPKEAAAVSGVSTALQRDWRRRGVLPQRIDKKWSTFELSDIIEMTVMRRFSQSGLSLESSAQIAGLAVLPVIATLSRWDDTAVFEGDELSDDEMDRCRKGAVGGVSEDEQFSFVALPGKEDGASAARLTNLSDGESIMAQNNSYHAIVLDHYGLAHHIAKSSPLPIIRYVVTVSEATANP